MASWYFKATTAAGELREGQMDAAARDAVIEVLRARQLTPLQVVESASGRTAARLSGMRRQRHLAPRELAFLTIELATLLDAGVPLVRALELLGRLAQRDSARALFTRVNGRVRAGASFSEAIGAEEASFGRFYVNLVRAGEQSGRLEVTLRRLAEYLERSAELRESLLGALWYPIILVVVAVLSMGLIVGVVVPRFAEMFADAGQALPWPTQVVLVAGEFLGQYGWLCAIMLAIAAFAARQALRNSARRLRFDGWLLRLPLLGPLMAEIEAGRFTRTLATLLGGGVTMADALPVAGQALSNRHVVEAVNGITQQVRAGRRLAQPMAESGAFPRLAVEMVKVGEEAGRMEEMLLKVADTYDREVAATLKRLVALAGPAVILVLGGMIALIILSILVAVLGVNELVT